MGCLKIESGFVCESSYVKAEHDWWMNRYNEFVNDVVDLITEEMGYSHQISLLIYIKHVERVGKDSLLSPIDTFEDIKEERGEMKLEKIKEVMTLYCDCCGGEIIQDNMILGNLREPVNHMEILSHHICKSCIRDVARELSKCVDEHTFKECLSKAEPAITVKDDVMLFTDNCVVPTVRTTNKHC